MSPFPIKSRTQSVVQTVAIGAAGAAWITSSAGQKRQWQTMPWSEQAPLTQCIDSVLSRLSLQQSSKIQWVVAPSLLKHWLQQAPEQTQSLNELHAITIQRAQQLFGSSATSSSTAASSTWVVSANWDVSRAFLSSAMPISWHTAIAGPVDQRGTSDLNFSTSITSPLQLILSSFQQKLPSNGWLSIAVANTLYLMFVNNKTYLHFRSLQLKTASSADDIQTVALLEWQRDMLRTQQRSEQLHCLCLLPAGERSNEKNGLVKPIKWQATHIPNVLDMDGNGASLSMAASQGELSEVKLAALCELQCSEGQR